MPRKPTVRECLDEIRRLRAENARLNRLVKSQRPELTALRAVACAVRDLAFNLPMQLESLRENARQLLPEGEDDLPSMEEMRGCLSDGRDRVYAALGEPSSTDCTSKSK